MSWLTSWSGSIVSACCLIHKNRRTASITSCKREVGSKPHFGGRNEPIFCRTWTGMLGFCRLRSMISIIENVKHSPNTVIVNFHCCCLASSRRREIHQTRQTGHSISVMPGAAPSGTPSGVPPTLFRRPRSQHHQDMLVLGTDGFF
jgi:hypothetical protein